jgi:hypothetical protein
VRDEKCYPDPDILPGVNRVLRSLAGDGSIYFKGVSDHASQVARLLCGDWSTAKGLVDTLYCYEATNWTGRGCLGGGKAWDGVAPWPPYAGFQWPFKPDYEVVNCSWGGMDLLWQEQICRIFDWWLATYNVFGFVGCPNLEEEARPGGVPAIMMSGSKNAVRVGSTDQPNTPLPGFAPEILCNDWSSFATPKVAAVGIQMIAECKKRGYAYKVAELKGLLLASGNKDLGLDIAGVRVPALDASNAIKTLVAKLDGVSVPPPPPPVKQQCHGITAKKKQCSRFQLATYCWQHMP